MHTTRDNHYVPQWYQKGFVSNPGDKLVYLNFSPDTKSLPNGKVITFNDRSHWSTSQCFYQTDLYTTFFGAHINDDIEKFLFGKIDDTGARGIRAPLHLIAEFAPAPGENTVLSSCALNDSTPEDAEY